MIPEFPRSQFTEIFPPREVKETEPISTLTIIVTNYNVGNLLRECLRSISYSRKDLQVTTVVVDNGSKDNSIEIVKNDFPNVKLITNPRNIGFAAANNLVLKDCETDFVLLLNSDTRLAKNAIDKLVWFMEKHPEAAVVGPKLVHEDGTVDWRCRRGFPSPRAMLYKTVGLSNFFPKSQQFNEYTLLHLLPDKTAEVDLVSGACMLVRSSVIKQVGLLDEGYFFHLEDIDWIWRIKNEKGVNGKNWKVFYCPEVEVIHHGGQSRRQLKIRASLEMLKSIKRFYRKHIREEYSPMGQKLLELGLYPFWVIQTIKILSHYLK